MGFNDIPIKAAELGKGVQGLVVSQAGAMTLEVATGIVNLHGSGGLVELESAQSHAFISDPMNETRVFMGLVTDGVDVDLWVDAYVDDGATVRADPPEGYVLITELAWFTIPAAETDLANSTINRRVWE